MIRSMIFFENKLSRYQCGFHKGFSIQNALLSMVEKMLLARDKKEVCEAILTDQKLLTVSVMICL